MAYGARQVAVPARDLAFYKWDGRTVEYHRAQVRKFLGFCECTVADAEKLAAWLAVDTEPDGEDGEGRGGVLHARSPYGGGQLFTLHIWVDGAQGARFCGQDG